MISIVIPNFNSGKLLVKNIPKLISLLKKTKLEYEIIVTDDASTDDSVAILTGLNPVNLVTSPVNTGFGTNVDRGIKMARGEFVFILNAIDLLPKSADYFQLMLNHFKNPKVFSVGATKYDVMHHGSGEIYFNRGYFLHRRSDGPKMLSAWADGGSQVIRRDYYFKIGGFDPLYKLYWEDVDLGYRAWKAGYEVHFEQKSLLIHQKEEGPIAKVYSEKEIKIMNVRNQMIFTWKNADTLFNISNILWFPYEVAVALKNMDGDWFSAYFQAISRAPEILFRRLQQKSVARVSDRELLKII